MFKIMREDIINLLAQSDTPLTASWLSFHFADFPFEKLCETVDELCQEGVVALCSEGYYLNVETEIGIIEEQQDESVSDEVEVPWAGCRDLFLVD